MEDNIKCKLLAHERCSKTEIIFTKDKWNEIRYDEWINKFKNNRNAHKIIKIEGEIEEILFEKGGNKVD